MLKAFVQGKTPVVNLADASVFDQLSTWTLWFRIFLLMIFFLHYLKDPKLWDLWYIPYHG